MGDRVLGHLGSQVGHVPLKLPGKHLRILRFPELGGLLELVIHLSLVLAGVKDEVKHAIVVKLVVAGLALVLEVCNVERLFQKLP